MLYLHKTLINSIIIINSNYYILHCQYLEYTSISNHINGFYDPQKCDYCQFPNFDIYFTV